MNLLCMNFHCAILKNSFVTHRVLMKWAWWRRTSVWKWGLANIMFKWEHRWIKGHGRDSDVWYLQTRCPRPLMSRWDIPVTWTSLTFIHRSVAILHWAGDFSGRQRGGRTLGALRRGMMKRVKRLYNNLHLRLQPKWLLSSLNTKQNVLRLFLLRNPSTNK